MKKEQIQDRIKQGRETILSAKGVIFMALVLAAAIIFCSIYGECGK